MHTPSESSIVPIGLITQKIYFVRSARVARFQAVFATIRQMLETPMPPKKPIGFLAKLELAANSAQTNKRIHK